MSGIVGNLQTLGPVRSAHLGNERPIYVWLPLSYNDGGDRTYPVLYMQDGQNLFSDELASGREWQVDEQMARLSARRGIVHAPPLAEGPYLTLSDRCQLIEIHPAAFLHSIKLTLVRTTSMKQSSLAQDGAMVAPSIQQLIPSSDGGDNEHG